MIDKKVRVADVAKAAGVSISTVSRALNHPKAVKPETAERIRLAFETLGVTSEPRERKSKAGGLILFSLPSIDNPFYGDIVSGATASADAHGYHLVILQENINSNTLSRVREIVRLPSIVGLISTGRRVDQRILQELDSIVPTVQCCEYNEACDLPFVSIDDVSAAKTATEYLISCGRNKIALVNGPLAYKYATQRLAGFKQAMEEHGLTVPNKWIVHLPKIDYDIAYSSICQLLNSPAPPNALFASSDVLAIAAIRAAKRYGIDVPRDLSIIGFDNLPISAMSVPSLTTVNQPRYQMGYTVCELLVERLRSPSAKQKSILLDVEIVVRESTALIGR